MEDLASSSTPFPFPFPIPRNWNNKKRISHLWLKQLWLDSRSFAHVIPAHRTLSFSYVILLYSFTIKVIFHLYYNFWYYQIFPSLIHVLSLTLHLSIYTHIYESFGSLQIWISSLPLKERLDILLVTTCKQPKHKERVAFLYIFSLCTCYRCTSSSSSSYWWRNMRWSKIWEPAILGLLDSSDTRIPRSLLLWNILREVTRFVSLMSITSLTCSCIFWVSLSLNWLHHFKPISSFCLFLLNVKPVDWKLSLALFVCR